MAEGGSVVDIEWSCPTCTYINKAGSFKCSVCGTPKGTATRQVKFHLSTLEQRYVAETLQSTRQQTARTLTKLQAHNHPTHIQNTNTSSQSKNETNASTVTSNTTSGQTQATSGVTVKKKYKMRMSAANSRSKLAQASKWPRLKNIDRSRIIRSQDITVNNVTVNITEYPLLYSDSE